MSCAVVLSEDLGDGPDYAGIRVINPFRRARLTYGINTCTTDVPIRAGLELAWARAGRCKRNGHLY
jgi:hypothetical protein